MLAIETKLEQEIPYTGHCIFFINSDVIEQPIKYKCRVALIRLQISIDPVNQRFCCLDINSHVSLPVLRAVRCQEVFCPVIFVPQALPCLQRFNQRKPVRIIVVAYIPIFDPPCEIV